MAEREQDAATMNDMEARVEEYKRKYDAVRIELRNLKGMGSVHQHEHRLMGDSYIDHVRVQAFHGRSPTRFCGWQHRRHQRVIVPKRRRWTARSCEVCQADRFEGT